MDKGEGGKYLFLPPGYKDKVPDGYFVIQSSSYRILLGFRSIQLAGATEAEPGKPFNPPPKLKSSIEKGLNQ